MPSPPQSDIFVDDWQVCLEEASALPVPLALRNATSFLLTEDAVDHPPVLVEAWNQVEEDEDEEDDFFDDEDDSDVDDDDDFFDDDEDLELDDDVDDEESALEKD